MLDARIASWKRLREAYDALAPEAHARFIFCTMGLVVSMAIASSMMWWIAGDLVIKALWLPADAVIVAPPRVGPPEQKRGHAYWTVMRAELPDGRRITGDAMRPIFDRILPADGPDVPLRRVSPHQGDRIAVYVRPRAPHRIMPATELNLFFPLIALGMSIVVMRRIFIDIWKTLRTSSAKDPY